MSLQHRHSTTQTEPNSRQTMHESRKERSASAAKKAKQVELVGHVRHQGLGYTSIPIAPIKRPQSAKLAKRRFPTRSSSSGKMTQRPVTACMEQCEV